MANHPVILCGGSGTRLWPLSRAMFPKQFIHFQGAGEASFLQAAASRLPRGQGFAAPTLLSNNDHRFLVADELAAAGIEARRIILEPVARNTAPAIAAAAYSIVAEDPDAIMVVMPSDHAIRNTAAFVGAVERAAAVARSGRLVLFGIAPDTPHTGYGYIRRGAPIGDLGSVYEVDAFVEKPDETKAREYLKAGMHLWNSGIFVLHARTYLDELARLAPDIAKAVKASVDRAKSDLGFLRLDPDTFGTSPAISVDYAVMEKTRTTAVLPVDFGWSDVGSWQSLWEIGMQDERGNVANGDTLLEDTANTYVSAQRALIATLGVKDLVIVETPDAVLVADKARAQDVGKLVSRLKAQKRTEHAQHVRSHRPWGYYETLSLGPRFQVKRLFVKPGGKLSMQKHLHRSEHWVVVHGTAKVTIGDTEQLVRENESVYIIATQWHRLENPGKVPLEIIETQIGSYLGEDDIERSDDIYQRAPDETR
jgi:mannose-1-phosphate guanylyltransferase/mannose-6-phosphate isomerase